MISFLPDIRKHLVLLFLLSSTPSLTHAQPDQWKDVYKESAWTERDKWQRADELITFMGIKTGSVVADVGCGEGYMTLKLSKKVGPLGKVYASDIKMSAIQSLKTKLSKASIKNVTAIQGDDDNPQLPADSVDAVIIVDSYHEMKKSKEILTHLYNSLKPGGRFVLCEPIAEERRKSSRANQTSSHELAMSFAIEDLTKAGFAISSRQDPFIDRSKIKGDKMWVVIAVRK